MAILSPGGSPFPGSPNSGGYDGLFANIIAAFSQSQASLVGPNKLLDMVQTDIDPSNTAYQGKTIEINFPDSAGKVQNINQMDKKVQYSPVKTIRRSLTLDQHPVYAFEIPDLDKALTARPEELRVMFVDEAVKKFTTYINGEIAKLIFNTNPLADPGTGDPFGTQFNVPAQDSLFKLNPASAPSGYDAEVWKGYANKGINPIVQSTGTVPDFGISTVASAWRKLTNALCPVTDVDNMFALVPTIAYEQMIKSPEWYQSSVGEGIAAQIRRTGVINKVYNFMADWELAIPQELGNGANSTTAGTNGGKQGEVRYHSFVFHRRALAVAYRPLELPPPSVGAQSSMAYYRGIPIRFMLTYDRDLFTYKISFDSLFGAMVYRPEFGVRCVSKWMTNTWD
ncbi:Major capsid protein Gp5 [uncultured Caudovirales phage]|uniref:Major capsid protein Gp5 n=1 Tax=uncultured Caudovirales phage TaxID=2100421 RepID=A0A6J7XJQ3_9CAUD|nr:Major capsid protein Gp5 [uncultured Caudovirales phage]